MANLGSVGAMEKLNEYNYREWRSCMKSYQRGKDLRDIVDGCEISPPSKDDKSYKSLNLCREIEQVAAEAKFGDHQIRRIIINGLRPEYNSFIAALQGWPKKPSLVELENLLTNQEALAQQMSKITIKPEIEEALDCKSGKKVHNNFIKTNKDDIPSEEERDFEATYAVVEDMSEEEECDLEETYPTKEDVSEDEWDLTASIISMMFGLKTWRVIKAPR
ncbi:hypothetical protein QQ045_023912 [Rhodiola kirilowii]